MDRGSGSCRPRFPQGAEAAARGRSAPPVCPPCPSAGGQRLASASHGSGNAFPSFPGGAVSAERAMASGSPACSESGGSEQHWSRGPRCEEEITVKAFF